MPWFMCWNRNNNKKRNKHFDFFLCCLFLVFFSFFFPFLFSFFFLSPFFSFLFLFFFSRILGRPKPPRLPRLLRPCYRPFGQNILQAFSLAAPGLSILFESVPIRTQVYLCALSNHFTKQTLSAPKQGTKISEAICKGCRIWHFDDSPKLV